ncbi:MAG: exodeoxyribonuclease VII large subunit [Mariprofundaceae bacterium]|nr:exodeoxyribonuclease VII large subunit [Mariprofundaceae bacterium]
MILPTQNSPLSVGELTAHIKQVLEQGFARVQVVGEVSRLTARASGHAYFTIKDANAALAAVIWKSTIVRLSSMPEEGRQYIFHGHISLYAPQGRYQLVVSRLEAAGGGALAAEFERRKQDFLARGWFDSARKLNIPPLPKHIGIVTSASAAALQDVRKVLTTRPGWLMLTLSPSLVQGQTAANEIVRALARLQNMTNPPDVILLVRGGGSPEDLWCFNDESVVRAIVDCPIPIISGIGHDIDNTLADFAADMQAATPSNAAELACPAAETLRRQMPRIALLNQFLHHRTAHARKTSEQAATRLTHRWQSLRDEQRMRLDRLQQAMQRLHDDLTPRLRREIHLRQAQLNNLGPQAVLKRGYALALDKHGHLVRSIHDIQAGKTLNIRLHDGLVDTQVKKLHPS